MDVRKARDSNVNAWWPAETDECAVTVSLSLVVTLTCVFVRLWHLSFTSGTMDHSEKGRRSDDEAEYEDEEVDPRIQVTHLYPQNKLISG